MGWGWGKGLMSLGRSESSTPSPFPREGTPPLDPSSALPPRRICDRVSGPAQGFTPCRTCGSKVTNEVHHLMRVSSWEGVGVDRPYFVSAQVLDSSRSLGMTRGDRGGGWGRGADVRKWKCEQAGHRRSPASVGGRKELSSGAMENYRAAAVGVRRAGCGPGVGGAGQGLGHGGSGATRPGKEAPAFTLESFSGGRCRWPISKGSR